jgi:hypothetical protein
MVTKKPKKKKPDKHPNPLQAIRDYLKDDRIFETGHALQRLQERKVTHFEYKYVLQHGNRERSKDKYDEQFEEWTYSMKGKTLENRELRVVVSFDAKLNIITVIDLEIES